MALDLGIVNTGFFACIKHCMAKVRTAATLLVSISVLLVFAGCIKRFYPSFPMPYPKKELVDSWIGLGEHGGLYKLVLSEYGTSVLYSQWADGTITTNRITRWTLHLNPGTLTCEIEGGTHGPASLECRIGQNDLTGTLSGAGGWTRQLLFQRAAVLQERLIHFQGSNGSPGLSVGHPRERDQAELPAKK